MKHIIDVLRSFIYKNVIRVVTIWLMKLMLKRAIKCKNKQDNQIIISAYNNMINSYRHTILYLTSHKSN